MDNGKRPLGPVKVDSQPEVRKLDFVEGGIVTGSATTTQPPKSRRKKAAWVLTILFILALLAAAVMAYLWYEETEKTASLESQNASLEAERDQLRNEQVSEPVNPDAPTSSDLNDDEQIMAAAREFVCVLARDDCQSYSLQRVGGIWESDTEEARFAQVTFGNEQAGGGGLTLKNTGGDWVVITHGQGISEQDRAMFDIPEMIVDEEQ